MGILMCGWEEEGKSRRWKGVFQALSSEAAGVLLSEIGGQGCGMNVWFTPPTFSLFYLFPSEEQSYLQVLRFTCWEGISTARNPNITVLTAAQNDAAHIFCESDQCCCVEEGEAPPSLPRSVGLDATQGTPCLKCCVWRPIWIEGRGLSLNENDWCLLATNKPLLQPCCEPKVDA